MLAAEMGYLSLDSDFSGRNVAIETSGLSVDLNAHYLFPANGTARVTPYLLAGIGHDRPVVMLPATGKTSAEADAGLGCSVAEIAKSIIFRRASAVGSPSRMPESTATPSSAQRRSSKSEW